MPATFKVLPPLRLLQISFPAVNFSNTMKFDPSLKFSRGISTFSRFFPHKLKYQSFRFPLVPFQHGKPVCAPLNFSTRSASSREPMASKSLIDDEADLSDWVSGLNSGSFKKTQVFTDSDAENGGPGRDNGSNKFRGREEKVGYRRGGSGFQKNGSFGNDRGSDKFRGREGVVDKRGGSRFGEGNGSGRGRNQAFGRDAGSKFMGREERVGSKREGSTFNNDRVSGRGRNQPFGRDTGSKFMGREERGGKRRREDSFDDPAKSRRRGADMVESFPKMNERFNNKRRDSDEVRAGKGRSSDMGYGRGNKGEGFQRGKLFVSDESDDAIEDDDETEEEEGGKGYTSFKGLIDSEDSDEVDEDDGDEDDEEEEDGALFEKQSVITETKSKDTPLSSPPEGNDSYLTETRFDGCSVSPLTLKALKAAGYEKMTVVQEATLPTILKGKDVLAKARTGTGKTVAFLLPSIEVVVKSPPIIRDEKRPPILVLIICPTRELASQAATEANTLLKYHPSIGVQVVIGGTRLALEQKRMQANPCQILVATPGRLRDHIENTAGFATRLMGVKVLVLDEADHLLDMGFRKDIENIVAAVPKQRQTLLFSATVPQEVRHICHVALKRDYEYVNTVEEGSEETHSQVRQTHLVAPLEKQFSILYALLKEHIADDIDYKVLVFCTTAMVTRLVADLLGELKLNVREIHSRKPQSYRTRVSDEFRKSKGLVLVTSDVSARGVDYPDVTLVIQIGLPAEREQYIHRLGRTGRKGKQGQGILILSPWEEFFLSTIKDLPISKAEVPLVDPETKKKVERALSNVEMKNKEAAYQAWLGYYNSNKTIARDKCRLVELANEFSRSMGLDTPPAIPKLVLGKMGLKNVPGLRSK